MTKRFCGQCGTEVPAGSSFCPACGAVRNTGAQQPYPNNIPPNPNPQPYQQPYQPAYQPSPQANRQPIGCNTPRVTSARATGLIVGIFALVAAAILIVLVFVLPSKEDFALLASGSQAQASENIKP